MLRGRWYLERLIERLRNGGRVFGREYRHLAMVTSQETFAELSADDIKAAFAGFKWRVEKGHLGRSKGGSGNASSAALVLARLACARGAWGARDVSKTTKLISRSEE